MAQKIAYPDNPIMAAGWLGCVNWAWGKPEIRAQFLKETGLILAPATPFERMIDKSCGVVYTPNEEIAEKFVAWVNENIWGEDPFTEVEDEDHHD